MTIKFLLACGGALVLLAGCGAGTAVMHGPTPYAAALGLATPPLNTIVTGPCQEEFGMPDSRRANCNLYYWIRGEDSPWEAREKYYAATTYLPGELQCTRTRGKIVDCTVVDGPPKKPPYIVAPNNLGSE